MVKAIKIGHYLGGLVLKRMVKTLLFIMIGGASGWLISFIFTWGKHLK
jgi:hypothetical protein